MTMKRGWLGLLLLLFLVGIGQAQDSTQPLILVKAGDLWEWTGGPMLRQKTQWGYNSNLVLSPFSNEVAYVSLPQIVVDVFKREPGGGGDSVFPNNLWVITTAASDLAYRIADQPADASFRAPSIPDKSLVRSNLMWSPDGSQIAWTEQSAPNELTFSLLVYDKAAQTSRTLATGLPQQAGPGPYSGGVWTENGIVLFNYALNREGMIENSYLVFDAITGEEKFNIAAGDITVDDDILEPKQAFPIQHQGKAFLAVLYVGQKTEARWQLIDLEAGAFTGEAANLVGFAPNHADTSLRVIPVAPLNQPYIHYVVQQANGVMVPFSDDPQKQILRFALSPDGDAIAYQLYSTQTPDPESTIYIWRNGSITTVPQTEYPAIIRDFVWGPITWEVGSEGSGVGAAGS